MSIAVLASALGVLVIAPMGSTSGEEAPVPAGAVVRHSLKDGSTSTPFVPRKSLRRVRSGNLAGRTVSPLTAPGALDLICCPPDNRYPIYNTTVFPYSTVCKVQMLFPSGNEYMGSAVMVGPKHALTAGHVLYDAGEGGWATDVLVTPGYDDGSAPLGSYFATNLYSLAGYIDYEDTNYDFGILEFDTAVGDMTGWLGYGVFSNATLLGASLTTAGFPGDIYGGERMYGAFGTCSGVTANLITYGGTLDTAGGQSGSGVWSVMDSSTYVVGVHTFGSPTHNGGTRITSAIFDYIVAVQEGGTPPEPPPPPPPGSVDTLTLYLGKSKLTDYESPGIDHLKLKAFYFFNEAATDTLINPISNGITIGIETEGQEALSLTLDADDPNWRVKSRRKAVWNGYIGPTRVKFTMDVVKQTIDLKLDWFDFDPLVFNPIGVTVLCGNDFGRRETNWFEYYPGFFRF